MHHNAKGIAFVYYEWNLTGIAVLAVGLRLYSRAFLTRSIGSDDFVLIPGTVCLNMTEHCVGEN